jgi:dinuclear metal center YbgI/SA1388 family protein
MPSVREICDCIEEFAPLSLQESWDNCGLLVGSPRKEVGSALLTIDVNEAVVREAADCRAGIIISHHPVILSGIRQLTGTTDAQRAVMAAVKNDIAIYAAHTNMDAAPGGVSCRMADKLGLSGIRVLSPTASGLQKLVAFIPKTHFSRVSEAIFQVGAGHVGNYDSCGFAAEGKGTFRALENARPFVGTPGKLHAEPEIRFETIFPSHLGRKIVAALRENHPYEEPAYDIYALHSAADSPAGMGVIGALPSPVSEQSFLRTLKEIFTVTVLRHTNLRGNEILNVALCGGSGSSLLGNAIRQKADVFVTADLKYHQFSDAAQDILIADIGHFESEQYTKEIFYEVLMKKFPNFAARFSKVKTNPINYL